MMSIPFSVGKLLERAIARVRRLYLVRGLSVVGVVWLIIDKKSPKRVNIDKGAACLGRDISDRALSDIAPIWEQDNRIF